MSIAEAAGRSVGGLGAWLWRERLFVGLALIFAYTTLAHLDFVPLWDGWAFFRHCYQGAANAGEFRCFGHSAFVPSAVYGLTQVISDGNRVLVYLLNMGLGLGAIVCLRACLRVIAGDRLGAAERTLLAFCLGLQPVFQAQLLQPSLDYTLAVIYPAFLLALLTRRHVWAAALGTAMAFTKEPGVVLYAASVLFYGLVLAFAPPRKIRLRALWRDRLWVFAVPAGLVLAYVLTFPPQSDAGSWSSVMARLIQFNPHSSFLKTQLLSGYVINFSWLVSALAIAGLVARPVLGWLRPERRLPEGVFNWRVLAFLAATMLTITYLFTRVEFANNPRYMLPIAPLLLMLAAHGLALIRWRLVRLAVLVLIPALFFASTHRTLDPLPGWLYFRTWDFGQHRLWSMSQPGNFWISHHGRDQLVYNIEFTRFDALTADVVQRYGPDAVYTADWRMTWNAFADLRSFDARTLHRTLRQDEHTRLITLLVQTDFVKRYRTRRRYPAEVFFIAYPNMDNRRELAKYLRDYRIVATETFERDGYALDVHRLQLR